jgi:hypothetical protein
MLVEAQTWSWPAQDLPRRVFWAGGFASKSDECSAYCGLRTWLGPNTERWEMHADRVRDRIMLFSHVRIGMAKLLGNYSHWHAAHVSFLRSSFKANEGGASQLLLAIKCSW